MTNQQLGKFGEDVAAQYLQQQGYLILRRNFRTKNGEVDIIAADGNHLHFVEVKTRRSVNCGTPAESVNGRKVHNMRASASEFLRRVKGMPGSGRIPQFDVIEIQIAHIENI